jgi:hypothetical protein
MLKKRRVVSPPSEEKKDGKENLSDGSFAVISFTNCNYRYVTMFTVNPPDIWCRKRFHSCPLESPTFLQYFCK